MVVWLDPILPYINDSEENLRGILAYCVEAKVYGIICFGMGLTLREGSREYFYKKLDEHFPGLKQKYHKKYGYSYELMSDNNSRLKDILRTECKSHGIVCSNKAIFAYLHEYKASPDVEQQLSIF